MLKCLKMEHTIVNFIYLFIYLVLMIAYGKECASLCNIMIFQTLVYIDLSEDQDD